jgi:lysophospholipase L1-like esterase
MTMPGTRRRRVRAATFLAALMAATAIAALLAPAALAVYPRSIAATGDSITRAFNTCRTAFTDCPANSWATGTEVGVNSFYLRIVAGNAAARGNLFNDAVSGAKMSNLPGQITNVVRQGVDYLTIEMGANDVCTSSEETMTSVASFQTSFESAIRTLREQLPGARISVGSIPNVYQLWSVLHTNRSATSTWGLLSICQSMLANPTSTSRADEERRIRVREREVEFNAVLARACEAYAQCKFDRNTGYNYRFEAGEVSTNDYFHPSVRGQTSIASVEWGVTWVF